MNRGEDDQIEFDGIDNIWLRAVTCTRYKLLQTRPEAGKADHSALKLDAPYYAELEEIKNKAAGSSPSNKQAINLGRLAVLNPVVNALILGILSLKLLSAGV